MSNMLPYIGHSFQSFIRGNNSNGPVEGRVLGDGRRSGTAQTENTVRHTKYGRIRGMVVDEGGCSTGVLVYCGS